MKPYPKIFLTFLFAVAALGWVTNSSASPIPYSFTQYDAYAQVTGVPNPMEDIKSSPPVNVFLKYLIFSYAGASAPDTSHLSANSSADMGIANSFLKATFNFINNFPAIRIQYDYAISANSPGTSFCEASINSFLMDMTSSLSIWGDNQQVRAEPFNTDEKSGSIDIVLFLILGHEYELFLSCETDGNAVNRCAASADMESIQITGVPLPSGVVLISSGLVGLLGFRKRFTRQE